jgi:hypothetical protein
VIFRRALYHYVKVLEKLRDDKELDFSNDIFRQDIQTNIARIEEMIKSLDGVDAMDTLDRNRKLMCCSLDSYISDLEKLKSNIFAKLHIGDASLPSIDFERVNQELEIAKRIQTRSCIELGY